jgi:hypothetical protein
MPEVVRWGLVLTLLALAPATAEAEEGAAEPSASVDELVSGLDSPDPAARITAIRALGDRREAAAAGPLANLLRADPVPEVRGWAVRALDSIGTPEARAALATAAQNDPDVRVRSVAAQLAGVAAAPGPQPGPASPFEAQAVAQPAPAPVVQQPYTPYSAYPPSYFQRRPSIPGRGLRIGGIVVTSVSYGLALIVGLALISAGAEDEYGYGEPELVDFGWKMLLPIVGPGVAAATNDFHEAQIPFWIWSLAEVAGVTLLAVGYARRARYLREQAADAQAAPEAPAGAEGEAEGAEGAGASRRRDVGVAVLPGPGGLSLAGWF